MRRLRARAPIAAALLGIAACGGTTELPRPGEGAEAADPGPTASMVRDGAEEQAPAPAADPDPERIYGRADLWKPNMDAVGPLDPYLAPLLYIPSPGDAPAGPGAAGEGAVPAAHVAAGDVRFDRDAPTVYFEDDAVPLGGRLHRQLTFVWYLARSPADEVLPQGLRITFATDGHPWFYEVLRVRSDEARVFAATSAEAAARAAYGAPPAGQPHALLAEPAPGSPPTRLAGVLVDGPVPMGPYAYGDPDGNHLDALHCRCEATRVGELRAMRTYALVPLSTLLPRLDADALASLDFGPPDWVALFLRLPPDF